VLAGGEGRRLGLGRPKALAALGGATLLDRAVATLEAACGDLLVAAPATLALPGCRAVRVDDPPGVAGPLAGLVAAARARPRCDAVVLGVDFPLVTPAWVAALLGHVASCDAVLPCPGGRPQPLAAVYTARALEHLVARFEAGERAVTAALAGLNAARLDDAALAALPGGADALLNVNTPDDLERALRALQGAGR